MPKIRRWFPVSHDINGDEEVWTLTEKFGDRSLRIWLECLSIADRNEGVVGPTWEGTRNVVAARSRSSRTKVGLVLDYCRTMKWLTSDLPVRVVKYSEYHRTREPNKSLLVPSEPSEPSEPLKDPKKEPQKAVDKSKEPEVDPEKNGLTKEVKEAGTRIYKLDPVKFRRLWIWMQKNRTYPPEVLLDAFQKFGPYAKQIDDYWPYLDKCLKKAWAEYQQGGSKREAAGDLEFLQTVVKGLEH